MWKLWIMWIVGGHNAENVELRFSKTLILQEKSMKKVESSGILCK